MIYSNILSKLQIESHQWIQLEYELSTTNLEFQCLSIEADVYYSLVFKQTPQVKIPTLQNSKNLQSKVNVQEQLITNQSNFNVDVIYIGLYNNQTNPIELQFKIVTYYEDDQSLYERNKIIIIITVCVIAALLLFTIGLSALRTRKKRLIRKQVQEAIRRNLNQQGNIDQQSPFRQANPSIYKGFQIRFIKDHFKANYYNKFLTTYPGLSQFEECAVCLESMKKANNKLLNVCLQECWH
ncbi:unnamed protein product [Paramecium sonneborni]|uniref:Transmembrane protein n=1 Tax=Paramecium sonneborni TaxID=65129 RepID=A0A8S1M2V4_9CILI|nr:unnamed protein product [Paramecium sonneborni]